MYGSFSENSEYSPNLDNDGFAPLIFIKSCVAENTTEPISLDGNCNIFNLRRSQLKQNISVNLCNKL